MCFTKSDKFPVTLNFSTKPDEGGAAYSIRIHCPSEAQKLLTILHFDSMKYIHTYPENLVYCIAFNIHHKLIRHTHP